MKLCITLAVALFSGAVVSFLIGEYGRTADDRRKKTEADLQQRRDDASEKRRLVGELRAVHHAIKTAQLRMRAHKSVLTYGKEIREVIIPQVAQLGDVYSDVRRHCGHLIPPSDAKAITDQIGIARSYLEALTNEFQNEYLKASRLQEADHKWRQDKVAKLVKDLQEPPTETDLQEAGETGSSVWSFLTSKEDSGRYRFSRLVIFLEHSDEQDVHGLDKNNDTHADKFSDPMRSAMDNIDQSQRGTETERTQEAKCLEILQPHKPDN